jgi:hypothetical protein
LRTLLALIFAAACVVPLVHADPAEGYDGYIAPTETGYVATQSDQFTINANAGDVITATLTWTDPSAELDLRYIPPGGSCTIAADPSTVTCFQNSLPSRIAGLEAGCTYPGNTELPFVGGQTSASFTKTVTTSGAQNVAVEAGWVNPVTSGGVSYHLEIYVNGVQVDISGQTPTSINYINGNGNFLCHVPLP